MFLLGGIAESAIQCIAHHRAPTEERNRRSEVEAPSFDFVIEIKERHARLNDSIGTLGVDLDDLAHAMKIQHHAFFYNRR